MIARPKPLGQLDAFRGRPIAFKAGKVAPGHTAFDVKVATIDGVPGDHFWGKSKRPLMQRGSTWHVVPGYHKIVFSWRSSDQAGQPGAGTIAYAVTRTGTLDVAQEFEADVSYHFLVTAVEGAGANASLAYEVRID